MPYRNPIAQKEYSRLYRIRNKERIDARIAKWQECNPEKVRKYKKKWDDNNKDKKSEYGKAYAKANPDKILAKVKAYQKRHPDRVRKQNKAYRLKNKDKVRKWQSDWQKRKRTTDLSFRILRSLRSRVGKALKSKYRKSKKTSDLLGCSLPDFILYLESKFEVGMSWENYGVGIGKWGIDHIMPCAIFDFTKPEHQRRCFHFSNQQPMWSVKNSAKHRRVVTNQFNLL